MSRTPEGRIASRVTNYAKSLGFLAKRNYNGPGVETGWPDHEYFLPGARVLLFEFKRPGGELRKIQKYRIAQLLQRGHHVYVCDSYESGKAILDAACEASAPAVDTAPLPEPRR
jgi:hypothetical protein